MDGRSVTLYEEVHPQRLYGNREVHRRFLAYVDKLLPVSTSADTYLPQPSGPLPRLADVEETRELVRKLEANEPVPEDKRRLIAPGTTLGGARHKALIELNERQWVVQ